MIRLTRNSRNILKGISLSLLISSVVVTSLIFPLYLSNKDWKDIDDYNWNDNINDRLPQAGLALSHEISLETITPFGTYVPINLNYTPSVVPTPIEPDLSNVDLLYRLQDWSNENLEKLATNGFILVDEPVDNIYAFHTRYSPYAENVQYISSDLCLHTFHNFYDMALRLIEGEWLYNDFETMIKAIRAYQIEQKALTVEDNASQAINMNIAYLSTILKLLNETNSIPLDVSFITNNELSKIENGIPAYSSIFGCYEDYSQYKVRGHYTRNEILGNYFKAMMYAGRMGFLFQNEYQDIDLAIEQTRMALLLVSSFNETINSQQVWDYWNRIYSVTSFFVSGSDDPTPLDYYKIWKYYGSPGIDDLGSDGFILKIIDDLKQLPLPKILSMIVGDIDENEFPRGFRLFGQGYIPDSYIFQELVFNKVNQRLMPKALDVFSVFGSERAAYLLHNENLTYSEYGDQILKLRNEFSNLTDYEWSQSLYWLQLYSLFPLLRSDYDGYPGYMQTGTWLDKSLMTALSSWTQLRHDSILYGKQSYTCLGLHDGIGYVEPYPELYARLSSLVQLMKDGLQTRGLLLNDFEYRLNKTINIFNWLMEISIKELENLPFTQEDIHFLDVVGDEMSVITTFNDAIYKKWSNDTDNRDALIADVHTDPNTGTVLEVATGDPFAIYVIVQDHEGNLRVAKGGTYSYYEFIQPMANRLTDEEWHEILETDPPDMPEWITNSIPIDMSMFGVPIMYCMTVDRKAF